MPLPPERRLQLALFAVAVVVFAGSLGPIRNYDYFWHLATGRWIVEHRALPESDPFSIASDDEPWINGEWLYQIVLRIAEATLGHRGISVLHACILAIFFSALFLYACRRSSPAAASVLSLLAFLGGAHRLGVRPETAGTILFAGFTCFALSAPGTRRLVAAVALAVLWINMHPSALLAPLLMTAAAAGARFRPLGTAGERASSTVVAGIAGTAAALAVNPYGLEGILAPLRLVRLASGTEFVNTEWLPSRPEQFPLLYLSIIVGTMFLVRKVCERRNIAETLIFLLLAVLAVRHVRNQGFFFTLLPILVSGALPELRPPMRRLAVAGAAIVALIIVSQRVPVEIGIDERMFPARAVDRLMASKLSGNVFNADQFGGYLIHRFYPQRRTIVDGRNELHEAYLARYARARLDGREWRRLLDDYDIALAVDEYHRETIDVVNPRSGKREVLPASLIYFPRSEWALIAFDDAAMVLARRSRHPADLIARLEYPTLVPDGERRGVDPRRALRELEELERVRREVGDSAVRRRMEQRARRDLAAARRGA